MFSTIVFIIAKEFLQKNKNDEIVNVYLFARIYSIIYCAVNSLNFISIKNEIKFCLWFKYSHRGQFIKERWARYDKAPHLPRSLLLWCYLWYIIFCLGSFPQWVIQDLPSCLAFLLIITWKIITSFLKLLHGVIAILTDNQRANKCNQMK